MIYGALFGERVIGARRRRKCREGRRCVRDAALVSKGGAVAPVVRSGV